MVNGKRLWTSRREEKDVFIHASAVRDAGLRFLNEGDELTFEVEDGEKVLPQSTAKTS